MANPYLNRWWPFFWLRLIVFININVLTAQIDELSINGYLSIPGWLFFSPFIDFRQCLFLLILVTLCGILGIFFIWLVFFFDSCLQTVVAFTAAGKLRTIVPVLFWLHILILFKLWQERDLFYFDMWSFKFSTCQKW